MFRGQALLDALPVLTPVHIPTSTLAVNIIHSGDPGNMVAHHGSKLTSMLSPIRHKPTVTAISPKMIQPTCTASPIGRLAPETLEEIIGFAPPAAQRALCRVSSLWHALCVRTIYADIVLSSPPAVVKCCRTLASNPTVAAAVRSFEIVYRRGLGSPELPPFYALVAHTLQQTHNLHRLSLRVPDPVYATAVLSSCHSLPRLGHFETCEGVLTESLVAFLNRHPRIRFLQLGAPAHATQHSSASNSDALNRHSQAQISLPHLEYFMGPSACVAPVVRCAALRAAVITDWDLDSFTGSFTNPPPHPVPHVGGNPPADTIDDSDPLAALAGSSTQTLNVLSVRAPLRTAPGGSNSTGLIRRIADELPHIYALNITSVAIDGDAQDAMHQLVVEDYGRHLARFTALQRLEINCVGLEEEEPGPQQTPLDARQAFVDAGDGPSAEPVADSGEAEEGEGPMQTEVTDAQMDAASAAVTAWGAACQTLVECVVPQSGTIKWVRVCENLWLPQSDVSSGYASSSSSDAEHIDTASVNVNDARQSRNNNNPATRWLRARNFIVR
ncbi:hypothetical protein C8R43DRAFT_43556 [Mycena crocata]|nr:hypothetical protein C8R43DRAFT_43556 [Mycena crocata]